MGLFSGIKKLFSGVSKVLQGLGQIAKVFNGILNSPLGGLLKTIFPPLNFAAGALNFASTLGDLSSSVGRGYNY